jgi:hypothetical protein
VKDCCSKPRYSGTRRRRLCANCGAVEIGSPTRIYYNIDFHGLDGEVSVKTKVPR